MKLLIAGDFAPVKQFDCQFNEKLLEKFMVAKKNDFAIVNLEGPLTNSNTPIFKKGPVLRIDPEWVKGIKQAGFNVVSLANNHIMDMGEKGLFDTFENCSKTGLMTVGAGKNLDEARKPLILEKEGVKIGILNFAEHEFYIADEIKPGANPVDPIDNFKDIQDLNTKVDKVIVIFHGGNEYYPYPRPGLVKLCRWYVDAGADAVVCHHSHTTSGYEIYQEAPIFYGIGNFFFPKKTNEISDWNYGFIVSLEISDITSLSFNLIPYYFDQNQIHILEESTKEKFLNEIQLKSEILKDNHKLHQQWQKFCESKHDQYIYNLLSYSRYDHLLFRLKIFKPEFFKKKIITLINYIFCESHQESISNLLLNSIDKNKKPPIT
jgi:poly-gamma-glutamate synthesis protein (capsule biosynthesis protein)